MIEKCNCFLCFEKDVLGRNNIRWLYWLHTASLVPVEGFVLEPYGGLWGLGWCFEVEAHVFVVFVFAGNCSLGPHVWENSPFREICRMATFGEAIMRETDVVPGNRKGCRSCRTILQLYSLCAVRDIGFCWMWQDREFVCCGSLRWRVAFMGGLRRWGCCNPSSSLCFFYDSFSFFFEGSSSQARRSESASLTMSSSSLSGYRGDEGGSAAIYQLR